MTGYAEARTIEKGWNIRVPIRAVNHRFLDLHCACRKVRAD